MFCFHCFTSAVDITPEMSPNTPLYVHSKSNHPPSIIKNIPESINRRLLEISSNAGVFDEAAKSYQEALGKSGYTFKLQFKPPQTSLPKSNRSRNIIWFNPPYNRNVKSNIGRQFLRLIDQSFPVGHKLRKIFNRNTLKLSYSCMPNVTQIISGHNKTILRKAAQTPQDQATKTCNCRKKDECPLKGTWLSEGVIYRATVTSLNNRTETYVGLTATNFKARWRNHQTSFNNEKSKNSTELSKYSWALKSKNERYTIGWKILEKAKPYTNLTGNASCVQQKNTSSSPNQSWHHWTSAMSYFLHVDTEESFSWDTLSSNWSFRAFEHALMLMWTAQVARAQVLQSSTVS